MIHTWRIFNLEANINTGLVTKVTYAAILKNEGLVIDQRSWQMDIIGDANDPEFIPYEQLTEPAVLKWVTDALGTDEINRIEAEMIAFGQAHLDAIAAVTTKNGIPWILESL